MSDCNTDRLSRRRSYLANDTYTELDICDLLTRHYTAIGLSFATVAGHSCRQSLVICGSFDLKRVLALGNDNDGDPDAVFPSYQISRHHRIQTNRSIQTKRPLLPRFVPAWLLHRANPTPEASGTAISAPPGWVLSHQKISDPAGGLAGILDAADLADLLADWGPCT